MSTLEERALEAAKRLYWDAPMQPTTYDWHRALTAFAASELALAKVKEMRDLLIRIENMLDNLHGYDATDINSIEDAKEAIRAILSPADGGKP